MRILFVEFFDCHFCIRFQKKVLLSSVCSGAATARTGESGRNTASGNVLFVFTVL